MRQIEWKQSDYDMLYLYVDNQKQTVKFSNMLNLEHMAAAVSKEFADELELQLTVELQNIIKQNTDLTEEEIQYAMTLAEQIIKIQEQNEKQYN